MGMGIRRLLRLELAKMNADITFHHPDGGEESIHLEKTFDSQEEFDETVAKVKKMIGEIPKPFNYLETINDKWRERYHRKQRR